MADWKYKENSSLRPFGPMNFILPDTLGVRRAVFNTLISAMDTKTMHLLNHLDN